MPRFIMAAGFTEKQSDAIWAAAGKGGTISDGLRAIVQAYVEAGEHRLKAERLKAQADELAAAADDARIVAFAVSVGANKRPRKLPNGPLVSVG